MQLSLIELNTLSLTDTIIALSHSQAAAVRRQVVLVVHVPRQLPLSLFECYIKTMAAKATSPKGCAFSIYN